MDRRFLPRCSDSAGNDFYRMPLTNSPFPTPNSFSNRHALPPRFVSSPAGPMGMDASPLCRPSALEGFRYRSPIQSPNIPLSPYGSRGPFCNSPFAVAGPNASFGTPSSGSSYGDPGSAGNFRHGAHKSWSGTQNNGREFGSGVKRSTPSFRQVRRTAGILHVTRSVTCDIVLCWCHYSRFIDST